MSPYLNDLFRLIHVVSIGLYSGALLAMLLLQSLLLRATDDGERRVLGRAAATIGRVFVNPAILLGFVTGLVWWLWRFSGAGGSLMACTPIYVHVMLTAGIVVVGFTQVWKKRVRQFAEAMETGRGFAEARPHLYKGTVFAALALAFTLAAYASVLFRVPNPPLRRCPPVSASVSTPDAPLPG